ncbi:hypothetical protein LTR08_009218 [Meristemomyces frigidus]|nr:hypothetical protein LTR08_009218 [Meristemomyces frigidus]
MVKRKATASSKPPPNPQMDIDGASSGSDDDDASLLNVDFEWFDPQPNVDFHGLKTLLRQLFDVDNQLFDLSALTELVLAQPLLGSTVKCDGNESDPYAFLTVLNLRQHCNEPVIQQLTQYLVSKAAAAATQVSMKHLEQLLARDSKAQVGLILTERFINMPHQTIPPMYNMLLEEISWALADKEPYAFTHYLVLSKTYTEVASKLDSAMDVEPPQAKKSKKAAASASASASAAATAAASEHFYFHPEDEVLHRHALAQCSFDYSRQEDEGASDAKRAFQEMGVRPQGHLILLEGSKFEGAVRAVKEYLGAES